MTQTLLSSKYQVVIPKEVREKLALKPGQKFVVYSRGGLIYLIPQMPIRKLRGMFKGVDLTDLRDKSDRLS